MYACGGGGNSYGGTSVPSASQGTNGDYYYQYDLTTGDVQITYVKLNGVWHKIAGGDISGGVVTITQSDYDALSQDEKTNGSAYYIDEVSNALDMTGASITRQSTMSATLGNGSVSWTMGGGSQIGLCINKAIDVTNVESIIYDMAITAFYGGGAYINNDSRRTSIYVGNTGITNYTMYPTQPQVLLEYVKVASYPNQRLDVSQLTGTMYFNMNLGGSTGSITNLRLCTNDRKIMYMDEKYIGKTIIT
jgi:hypothetical protein